MKDGGELAKALLATDLRGASDKTVLDFSKAFDDAMYKRAFRRFLFLSESFKVIRQLTNLPCTRRPNSLGEGERASLHTHHRYNSRLLYDHCFLFPFTSCGSWRIGVGGSGA